jgi:hypothetical protein
MKQLVTRAPPNNNNFIIARSQTRRFDFNWSLSSNDKLGYQSEPSLVPVGQGSSTLTNDSSPARTSPARTVARVVQQGQVQQGQWHV